MTLRHRYLRQISRFLPRFLSGFHYQPSKRVLNLVASSSTFLPQQCNEFNSAFSESFSVSFRYSTISQASQDPCAETQLSTFIESTYDQLQGPHHCWFNRDDKGRDSLKKDGTFLIVAGRSFDSSENVVIIEKVKLLQQRFPWLCVIGFQDCSYIGSADDQSQLVRLMMKEYITFPILLSNKSFSQLTEGACYILSKGFKNPQVYREKDLDLANLTKVIKELSAQNQVNSITIHNLKSSWSKEAEIISKPRCCTALQNLLLYFPGLGFSCHYFL